MYLFYKSFKKEFYEQNLLIFPTDNADITNTQYFECHILLSGFIDFHQKCWHTSISHKLKIEIQQKSNSKDKEIDVFANY